MSQASVTALKGSETFSCEINFSDAEPHRISAKIAGLFEHEGPCEDVFEGLCDIRRKLSPMGIKLLCAGARRDVYPSGMARQMSGGVVAYRLKMGSPAQRPDVVRIFDAAEADEVGTVEEQADYFRRWSASLK